MAIEKLKRTWFLLERGELDRFVHRLADSRTTHVIDLKEDRNARKDGAAEGEPVFQPAARPSDEGRLAAEDRIQKLTRTLAVLDAFVPPRKSLAETFVTVPVEMKRRDFENAVAGVDIEQVFEKITAAAREHGNTVKKIEHLRERVSQLELWNHAMAPPAGLARCRADLGTVPMRDLPALLEAARRQEGLALEPSVVWNGRTLLAVVWLPEIERETSDLLAEHGFESLPLEPGQGRISDEVEKLRSEITAHEAEADRHAGAIKEWAPRRLALVATLAHWQAELERHHAFGKTLASNRVVVLSGYVRVRELARLENLLAQEFPSIGLVAEDPKPEEDIPVSLGGSRLFAPAQFLTSMFGLPNYFGFDPSPYILFTFLVFFGLCFGDAIYGAALLALGWWLAVKSGENRSLAKLFTLLALGGVSSIIVGVLTGAWAADFLAAAPGGGSKYLGSGAVAMALVRMQESLALFDPVQKPVVALGMALAVGVLNQFYAIGLLMYREARKGDYFAAFCDGGLWLFFLPGLMLLLASASGALPAWVSKTALAMVGVSGAALVLTQGRREKGFLAKALTGLVSLYGIVGTYGATSFVGDILSYSRLLALGLTTTIVGQSSNLIANLAGGTPFLGLVFFLLLLVLFHGGNFVISILGGFVHSVRLIFVEFFTKFYEGGARPFQPLGAPVSVRVLEE